MTASAGKDAVVYCNGYDLSDYLTGLDVAATADMLETTCLNSDDKAFIPGLAASTVGGSGIFDSDAAADATWAAALGGSSDTWLYLPYGDGAGYSAKGMVTRESAYGLTSPVAGVTAVTVSAQGSGPHDGSLLIHSPYATVTAATGSGTAIDNSSSSLTGGVGYLQVVATTGSLAVKIRDSADDDTYADLIAFTAATGVGAERKAVTGTVDEYTKCTWALSTGSASFIVAFGRKP